MSANLNLPQLTQGQAAPEVTANNATGALDAALTEAFTCDGTAGNVTVTSAQYRAALKFFITNIPSARNITFPAVKRVVIVDVDPANVNIATLVVGSTSIALTNGSTYIVATDGTANGLTLLSLGSGLSASIAGVAYDVNIFQSGVMVNAQEFFRLNAVRPFTLPINLTGSVVTAGVAATASTTLTIKKNGASIGTLVWAIAGTTATITFAAAVSFAVNDILTVTGPATADATLANIALNLKGSR